MIFLYETWGNTVVPNNIISNSGFNGSEIYPFNPKALNYGANAVNCTNSTSSVNGTGGVLSSVNGTSSVPMQ